MNIDQLELFLADKFENMDADVVNNCVMSMKKRCLGLIDSNGERIKYWSTIFNKLIVRR